MKKFVVDGGKKAIRRGGGKEGIVWEIKLTNSQEVNLNKQQVDVVSACCYDGKLNIPAEGDSGLGDVDDSGECEAKSPVASA